ncbi:molybdenum ABC transporter, periplasmic molybdate-binding protein [Oscillochloris trichoides DG-6]|uniref:Molybdenum ABC transporter, periplasmic molybdate-binding protein n=1 Tax=Oscillochloris trichoides DG-6 TaxID=765420 RepID=E1IEW6_9CHLR|nr:molybdate ABC transporter substrate-binding protein [Oscillochloris trichoides]EFO80263.1 molybdenum ABC transporter, periplasmic molybdate-binding protein [Oscillochloris trichoides DG-6]
MSPRRQSPLTIEHAILGFLQERPLHAYALHQELSAPDALGQIWYVKLSHFYALVGKLIQAGYVVSEDDQHEAAPRKLLMLTKAGRAAFTDWLRGPVTDPDQLRIDLLARLYFAQQTGPEAVQRLLSNQRAVVRAWRDHLRRQLIQRADQPDAGLFIQLRVRQMESLLRWLDHPFAPLREMPPVTYSIAVVADSHLPDLAAAFVDYVRSPLGQSRLVHAGFATVPALPSEAPAMLDAPPTPARSLHIFAAASLASAFHTIAADFTAHHAGVDLRFTFGGSYHLSAQLTRGAPADVFAPAHRQAMDLAIHAGRVWPESVYPFASNQLVLVSAPTAPVQLRQPEDLTRPGLRLALGSDQTAVGKYTRDLLHQLAERGMLGSAGYAGVLRNVVYYGSSVNEVMACITRGDADAGIVFASDGKQASDLVQMPIL